MQRDKLIHTRLEILRPDLKTAGPIDQLHRNPQVVAVPSELPLEKHLHAKLLGNFRYVLDLVTKRDR